MVRRVRRTPGGVDEYGDPIASTDITDTLTGAFVAPRMSEDVEGKGRAGVVVGLTLFAPAGTDLVRSDLIEAQGRRWRIVGDIAVWSHPWTGWEPGVTAALEATEG